MANKTVTKKDYFVALRALVEGVDKVGDYPSKCVVNFIDRQIAQIEYKAEKAKEKAAEKKTVGDELRKAVYEVLTNEFQTADEITSQIEGFEDLTKSKVVARLTQLVKAGTVAKESIKVDDSRKMAYKRISEDDVSEDIVSPVDGE